MGGKKPCRGVAGQMAVELAVLMPVMIVVGLIVYNLMRYTELCALFDRVALDAVVSQGIAPSGTLADWAATDAVRSCIEESLPRDRVEIAVEVRGVSGERGSGRSGLSFPISPLLTEFRCTLRYRPWPVSLSIAGVPYGSPLVLTHERTLVVDRFRAGVVI